MVDLGLLHNPTFVGANLVSMLFPGSYWAVLFYLPLFLQHADHLSPLRAGFAVLPLTVPLLVVPPIAARPARLLTPHRALVLGQVLIAGGLGAMAFSINGGGWQALVLPSIIAGIGGGLTNSFAAVAAMTAAPPERSGMASGINSTMRQVGFAAGIAVLGLVLTNTTEHAIIAASKSAASVPGYAHGLAQAALGGGRPGIASGVDQDTANALSALDLIQGMRMVTLAAAAIAVVGACCCPLKIGQGYLLVGLVGGDEFCG